MEPAIKPLFADQLMSYFLSIIVCSNNPLSADIITAKIMGEPPKRVPHIKYALTHGFKYAENLMLIDEMDVLSENKKFKHLSEREYFRLRRNLFLKKFRLFWVPLIKRLG